MPNDMTIPAVKAVTTNPDPPASRSSGSKRAEPVPAAASPYVNPTLRLDGELGLVVMEFRDDSGSLTTTIPSERQIEAYRAHQAQGSARPTEDARAADRMTPQSDEPSVDPDAG